MSSHTSIDPHGDPQGDRPGEFRPAGFWLRAVSMALDFVVFGVVKFSFDRIGARLFGLEMGTAWPALFTLLFTAAYTTLLSAVGGQTIGKMIVGIRVVGPDGEAPTIGPAFMRYLAYFVSLATFGLGFAMAGLRRDKRALHDLMAGTRVERAQAPRAEPVVPAPVDQLAPPLA